MTENANSTLDRCLQAGTRLARTGRMDAAGDAFRAALEINPESLAALNSLGVIGILRGDYPRAFKYLLAAYKLAPEDAVTNKNFGNALEGLGKFDEAVALYRLFLNTGYDKDISALLVRCLEKTTSTAQPVPLQPDDRGRRQIVFISDHPWSREVKIASALKDCGWDTILLHRHALAKESTARFAAARRYASPEEALALAHAYRPALFHVFSNWDFEVAAAIIRKKPGKVIFDDYDVMTGMVNVDLVRRGQPGQLELELFCLKNADGLCCRSLETQYVFRRLNTVQTARRIYFPDYMWGALLPGNPVAVHGSRKDRTLVYCGSYPDLDPRNTSNNWISTMAAVLRPGGYTLHLYPTASCDPDYQRHFSESNLVFHRHRDPVNLIHEMARYTAGLQVPNRMYRMTMRYGPEKRRYSTSCKIFDYLDAGLPVCIEDQRFQAWILNRYDAAVHLEQALLNTPDIKGADDILNAKKNRIHSRLPEISRKLAVGGQIHRLIRFYEKITREG